MNMYHRFSMPFFPSSVCGGLNSSPAVVHSVPKAGFLSLVALSIMFAPPSIARALDTHELAHECSAQAPLQHVSDTSNQSVVVNVRMVKAVHGASGINTEHGDAQAVPAIDARLEDLRTKLEKLQFSSYKLLAAQHLVVPLKKKQALSLVNGQTLMMRPLYVNQQKIGLWLKWKDGTGMEILDTRLHFDDGQSVLTGTDSALDTGIILAIDVSAKQPEQ